MAWHDDLTEDHLPLQCRMEMLMQDVNVVVMMFLTNLIFFILIQVFIYTMDRIVWLIVLSVVANFLLECSGVWAETKDSRSYGSVAAPYQLQRASNNVNPNDVELVDPMNAEPTENEGRASRNKLFDNIFKV